MKYSEWAISCIFNATIKPRCMCSATFSILKVLFSSIQRILLQHIYDLFVKLNFFRDKADHF